MIYKANDKYASVLSSGYTVGQSTLYVSAVPDNVPTIVVAAKGTDNETVFEVTDKTTNSLTGVSRLRGANVDLDAQTPLTCLNNEEFMNQYVPLFYLLSNGWQDAEETWTYASSTTITVPAGATAKYQKGDKIRLKQGGDWKYFYVIGVADTVLTVTGGSDYTLADVAITDNYYSKAENPQGFPGSFGFTATGSASASMTWTNITWTQTKFVIQGRKCTIWMSATGTTGGTASYILYAYITSGHIPDPVEEVFTGCLVNDPNGYGGWCQLVVSKRVSAIKHDRSNFGLGDGRGLGLTISYFF